MDKKYWNNRYFGINQNIRQENYTTIHYFKNGERVATVVGRPNAKKTVTFFGKYAKSSLPIDSLSSIFNVKEEIFDEEAYTKDKNENSLKQKEFWNGFKIVLFECHGLNEDDAKANMFFEILRSQNGNNINKIIDDAEVWVALIK